MRWFFKASFFLTIGFLLAALIGHIAMDYTTSPLLELSIYANLAFGMITGGLFFFLLVASNEQDSLPIQDVFDHSDVEPGMSHAIFIFISIGLLLGSAYVFYFVIPPLWRAANITG